MLRVATQSAAPVEPVVADPKVVPLSLNAIDLPLINALVLAFFSVAVSVDDPPKVPEAGSTVRVVFWTLLATTVPFVPPEL